MLVLPATPDAADQGHIETLRKHGFQASAPLFEQAPGDRVGALRHVASGFEGFWSIDRYQGVESLSISIRMNFGSYISPDRFRSKLSVEELGTAVIGIDGSISFWAGSIPEDSYRPLAEGLAMAKQIVALVGKRPRPLTEDDRRGTAKAAKLPPKLKIASMTATDAFQIAQQFDWPGTRPFHPSRRGISFKFGFGRHAPLRFNVHDPYMHFGSKVGEPRFRYESRHSYIDVALATNLDGFLAQNLPGWIISPRTARTVWAVKPIPLNDGITLAEISRIAKKSVEEIDEIWSIAQPPPGEWSPQ